MPRRRLLSGARAAPRQHGAARPRGVNWPNLLTFGRILAVPVVVALLFWDKEHWMRWAALAVFVAAGITDYLDGYLARALSQHSSLGQMLDPIADKLLVAATLLMLVADGSIRSWTLWAAIVILCREILVSGLREFLAGVSVSLPVSRLAKAKTAVQLVALGFLIAGPAGDALLAQLGLVRALGLDGLDPTGGVGRGLLWIAAAVTLITGWDYMRAGLRHVRD